MHARHAVLAFCFLFAGAAGFGVAQLVAGPDAVAERAATKIMASPLLDEAASSLALNPKHLHLSARAELPSDRRQRRFEVGDRITVGGAIGLKRIFKVVDIRRARLDHGPDLSGRGQTTSITVVTAVDLEHPDDKPLRFIVEGDGARGENPKSASLQTGARAL
ncbi:MAG: hypothetical protein AAFQ45_03915 [Pseudomonadota bacterium]